MFFAKKNEHTIPLFINAKILPLKFLYYKTLAAMMHDVSTASVPINIRNFFTKTSSAHSYKTRSSTSENLYIKVLRLEIQKKAPFQEWVLNKSKVKYFRKTKSFQYVAFQRRNRWIAEVDLKEVYTIVVVS